MAVPRRQNDMEEEENDLFVEEGLIEVEESDTPPHLLELAAAAQLGDVDALRVALDNLTGSIDEPMEDGDTALHLACLYGYLPCVKLLLERGASLDAKDEDGAIPLHDACAGGFLEIVQLIINHAGTPENLKRMLESVDAEGDTPLHHAARGEHPAVIRLLLASGASLTAANLYGKVPYDLADPGTEARRTFEATESVVASQ